MADKNLINKKEYPNGDVVTTLMLEEYEVLVYQPVNELMSDILNYSFSCPLLLVFGDKSYTVDSARDYADETGLTKIAAENGGSVVFVNPKGTDTWEQEEKGAYEAILHGCSIGQWNFKDGIVEIHAPNPEMTFEKAMPDMRKMFLPEITSYAIFAASARTYVYGIGSGADYLGRFYLRELTESSGFGDLGKANITACCITLVGMNSVPSPEKNDLKIISVNNSIEVNSILSDNCGDVFAKDDIAFFEDYREVVGKVRRWAGRLMKGYVYPEEQIVIEAGICKVETSADNFFIPKENSTHDVAYLAFYNRNLDVKNRKVPLLFCFHGGGDSAMATASIAEWPEIASENGFLLVAVEMHLGVTATETMSLLEELKKIYAIDETRIYATGFSMGGAKSWDMYQEYPEIFAALAPMDATFAPGLNCSGQLAQRFNREVLVPVFYVAGENSPLPEAPCQGDKCVERIANLFEVNRVEAPYECKYDDRNNWIDPVWGIHGDYVEKHLDPDYPGSITTINYFVSGDGNVYTALTSVSNHQHEIRPNTCRFAWKFMKQFSRENDGSIKLHKQ